MDKEQIDKDFNFLKNDEDVLAILVFGSSVKDKMHSQSDIDICIVAPGKESWTVLKEVYPEVNLEKKKYDVHTFEELTLKMKHSVIENHQLVWTRNRGKLEEYFYKYRKLWQDQAKARGIA